MFRASFSSMVHFGGDSMTMRLFLATVVSFALVACTGGSDSGNTSASGGASSSPGASASTPAALPKTPPSMAGEAPTPDVAKIELPEGVTAEMVETGRQVYMGKKGGGICFTCHGMDAKGSMLAPAQDDSEFLHGDGSYASIMDIIKTGIAQDKLKLSAAPMLPYGGAQLNDEHLKAVAAYIYALSQSGS
jgi:mono/diheme cytochrome c family protein